VTIGKRVWIGDGAVILPGAQIGHGAIIGANAVVTGIIPDNCIAVGLPAHAIRRYDVEAMRWVEWQ
jgi:lipopolysaccharide O-acetyltransferase